MRYIIGCFSLLLFISCEEENEDNCTVNRICTDIFSTVTIQVTDQNGEPVILDNYYTFFDQRKRFDFTDSSFLLGEGVYVVATDNEMPDINFDGTNAVFVGQINGDNVVEEPLILGKDCCHIELVQGKTEIQIEL